MRQYKLDLSLSLVATLMLILLDLDATPAPFNWAVCWSAGYLCATGLHDLVYGDFIKKYWP